MRLIKESTRSLGKRSGSVPRYLAVDMSDIDFIEQAFAKRARPAQVRDMTHPADEIYGDADALSGMDWRDITCALLETHYNAPSGFSPEAFCYYLPGIYTAGMREGRPDLLVNDALIIGLDRGNAPASWDDFLGRDGRVSHRRNARRLSDGSCG